MGREMVKKLLAVLLFVPVLGYSAEVKLEKISYAGWQNCVKLNNGKIELVVTLDVGPRIIKFGFINSKNLFKEYTEQSGKTGGSDWRIYGGHRLWYAPEDSVRTYWPDNVPVKYEWDKKTLKLIQQQETTTQIQKKIDIMMDNKTNKVTVVHRFINKGLWEIELAPWCLTVMTQNGRAIFPQEPYKPHPDYLLPARPLVLWH
jgi:hypothetical protein